MGPPFSHPWAWTYARQHRRGVSPRAHYTRPLFLRPRRRLVPHKVPRAIRRQFRGRSFRRELASGALRRGMQAARRQSFAPPLGLPFLFSAVGGALFQISAKCTDYRVVYQVGALFPKKCHCQEHFARSASFSALCLAAAHPYEERRNVCMRWSQMRRLRTLS